MKRRVATANFLHVYHTFLRKHPDLEEKVEQTIDKIAAGSRSSLYHPLHGKLAGLYAARVTQSYRLVFALDTDAVIFVDIGSHDEVY